MSCGRRHDFGCSDTEVRQLEDVGTFSSQFIHSGSVSVSVVNSDLADVISIEGIDSSQQPSFGAYLGIARSVLSNERSNHPRTRSSHREDHPENFA